MAATTGQLGLVTPTQGTLTGTWGDTVNNGITEYTNIAIAGTLTLTGDGAVTLANTTGDNSASNITSTLTGAGTVTAQFAIVKVSGTLTTTKVVTAPSYSKTYTVVNSATGGTVTFKASGQTGVSIAVGETAFVYFNGTDYVKVVGTATAGPAGGSNTQVQFNSSGVLAGSANLTFNGTTLTAAGLSGPHDGTVGATTPNTGAFTTLAASGAVTLSGGTANGVTYLNGSKVLTSGTALSFSGAELLNSQNSNGGTYIVNRNVSTGTASTAYMISDATAAFTGYTAMGSRSSGYTTSGMLEASSGGLLSVGLSNGLNIMTLDAYPVKLGVGNTEYMRLTGGNVGIGTSSPSNKLEVSESGTGAGFGGITAATATGGGNAGYLFRTGGSNRWSIVTIGSAGSESLRFYDVTNSAERMRLDSAGNLGLGVTPSAWNTGYKALEVKSSGGLAADGTADVLLLQNAYLNSSGQWIRRNAQAVGIYNISGASHVWYQSASSTAGSVATLTQAMTLDASGNLLVGTTGSLASSASRIRVTTSSGPTLDVQQTGGAGNACGAFWNTATSGDNIFHLFYTEAGGTLRGSISFNRTAGLVSYNTTSDYRAKDISGYITNSGALIDSIPVYMGTMKGATQERPMFIAHEVPAYAHTGEKDAVDADGNPVYQQMDASALIPVMWAEIQSLRQRLSAANL